MDQGSLKTKELIFHIRMRDSRFLPTVSALLAYNYRKKKYTVILMDRKDLGTGKELKHIAHIPPVRTT